MLQTNFWNRSLFHVFVCKCTYHIHLFFHNLFIFCGIFLIFLIFLINGKQHNNGAYSVEMLKHVLSPPAKPTIDAALALGSMVEAISFMQTFQTCQWPHPKSPQASNSISINLPWWMTMRFLEAFILQMKVGYQLPYHTALYSTKRLKFWYIQDLGLVDFGYTVYLLRLPALSNPENCLLLLLCLSTWDSHKEYGLKLPIHPPGVWTAQNRSERIAKMIIF